MSYTTETRVPPELAASEQALLSNGHTYGEIAAALGVRKLSVAVRNQIIYKIDVFEAFRARLAREGMDRFSRLSISDGFGNWFAGFFAGEGCFAIHARRQADGRLDRQMAIKVSLRDDDLSILQEIQRELGVGRIHRRVRSEREAKNGNPIATLTVQRIADLAEVIAPLFDRYPLRAKKAREYPVWRAALMDQYARTMGGVSRRRPGGSEYDERFMAAVAEVRRIRSYRSPEAAA